MQNIHELFEASSYTKQSVNEIVLYESIIVVVPETWNVSLFIFWLISTSIFYNFYLFWILS